MEQRIVKLQIANEYIMGAGVSIGAVGSHDDVLLEMDFRSSAQWAGTTRRAIFANALGENRTPIILTTNLLEEGQSDVYLVPVPAEAKTVAGECFLTVEGYIGEGESEIVRVVTEEVYFRVLPSKLYSNDNPSLTPSEAEQLQAQLEDIKEDIVRAGQASDALEKTEAARDEARISEANAQVWAEGGTLLPHNGGAALQEVIPGAKGYAEQAAGSAGNAAASAGVAQNAAGSAAGSAGNAGAAQAQAESAAILAEASRQAAAQSQQAADASAKNAAGSATEAKTAAETAAADAAEAAASKVDTKMAGYVSDAQAAQRAAETAAVDASQNATGAAQYADVARKSATSAIEAEAQARACKDDAEASRKAAADSAAHAFDSATMAAAAAGKAAEEAAERAAQEAAAEATAGVKNELSDYVDDAEEAKAGAEAAQAAAEKARNEAQAIAGGDFLLLAGGDMTGAIARKYDKVTTHTNVAAKSFGWNNAIGVIAISFPNTNMMVDMEIEILGYNIVGSLNFTGYTYIEYTFWHAVRAKGSFNGVNPTVCAAVGADGRRYLLLGNSDTNWGGMTSASIPRLTVGTVGVDESVSDIGIELWTDTTAATNTMTLDYSGTTPVNPANFSAAVPIAKGGTGAVSAADALNNLGALPTAGGTMTGVLTLDPESAHINTRAVELLPAVGAAHGGVIDFHFGGSTEDYTTRLIEHALGELYLQGKLRVEGDIYERDVRVYSPLNKPTPADIGAPTVNEMNTAIANAIGSAIGGSY